MQSNRKPATLLTRLQEVLKDQNMLAQIRRNEGSRLFDNLPEEFDQIFVDLNQEANKLGELLTSIKRSDITMTDTGPLFQQEAHKAKLRNWAKRIMAKACAELLDANNEILPEMLALLGKKQQTKSDNGRNTISSNTLILAYFSIGFQYIGKRINASTLINVIDNDVFQTCMLFMNNSRKWVDDVLKDRLKPVKSTYLDHYPASSTEIDTDLLIGVGTALFGLFAMGGAAAYKFYKKMNEEDQRIQSRSDSEDDHSPPRSPDNLYYF